MHEENNVQNSRQALRRQIAMVEQLRELPFDDPSYEEWRGETGQILDQIFGQVQSEQNPCTKAFLNYRIPEHFTATREQMQEYYRNILHYQVDLLKMYMDDTQDQASDTLC